MINEHEFIITLATSKKDGIILWKKENNTIDHFELRIRDGYLVYRHKVNNSMLRLRSPNIISDSKMHIIYILRFIYNPVSN